MSRFRILRFAAISWLPLCVLVTSAQAQTPFNVATDWRTTYSSTATVAASTSATWGPVNNNLTAPVNTGWSSGVFSYNWVNSTATTGNGSQYLPTYYNPSTGYDTSGATTVSTFTYTVPFQAYQLNPGTTISRSVGPTVAAMSLNGFKSVTGTKVGLPSNWTASNTSTTGNIKEVAVGSSSGFVASEFGFHSGSGSMQDGGGSVQGQYAGAYYNYSATNSTGSGIAMQNAASGSLDNVIMLEGAMGPGYVAWTAPAAGTLTSIVVNAWDVHEQGTSPGNGDNDGYAGFAVYTAPNQSTLGTALFSALKENGTGSVGSMQSYVSAPGGGTANASIAALNGYPTNGTAGASFGVGWTDSSLSVTKGQVLWFISDSEHTYNGNHAFLGGADPIALQASFNFVNTPEPSSFVLMGMAGIGLALAAWKRRRLA